MCCIIHGLGSGAMAGGDARMKKGQTLKAGQRHRCRDDAGIRWVGLTDGKLQHPRSSECLLHTAEHGGRFSYSYRSGVYREVVFRQRPSSGRKQQRTFSVHIVHIPTHGMKV